MNAGRPFVIDLFAGGGGASLGIRRALGQCPDVAVNHNPAAIEMHAANHPDTLYLREDVFAVDPATTCAGRGVRLLWASPDCTHFSRAKGGTGCGANGGRVIAPSPTEVGDPSAGAVSCSTCGRSIRQTRQIAPPLHTHYRTPPRLQDF